jgi:glycosyltransferase involved in cell wall biosynthesis/uncharacterized protein YecA (UPF0149 family)/tetratricopeptide (TPR) repeat protein
MNEQEMINLVYTKLKKGEDLASEIETIQKRYPTSVVLQYYTGVYYERIFDITSAEEQYLKCIHMSHLFTPPYFSLCAYYTSVGKFEEAEEKLTSIFMKKTIDPTSIIPRYHINYIENIRICAMLCPEYIKRNKKDKALVMYTTMISGMRSLKTPIEYAHVEGWKNLCYGAGNILNDSDPEKAITYYVDGLNGFGKDYTPMNSTEEDMLYTLDKLLLHGYNLARSYVINPPPSPRTVNSMYEKYRLPTNGDDDEPPLPRRSDKIRIGYISPDLNKNAVGLFVTPLLKHFDSSKFELFCYYNNEFSDEFTQVFRSYPNIKWSNVFKKPVEELYKLIKYDDQIDILVDLIAGGVNNTMELLAMSPAPIIVNYLGYPDFTHLKEVTHRLTDAIADPVQLPLSSYRQDHQNGYTEKLVRLPRCFICYSLFENIALPDISYVPHDAGVVRLGLMNKVSKHHKVIRDVWLSVLKEKSNYLLCIKLGKDQTAESLRKTVYKEFPQNQLEFLPFTDSLEEYLEQYNRIDVCVDTYPYSGTTTTCSSLLMGVPVMTVYNQANRHVSNVTASILYHTDDDLYQKYVCASLEDYKQRLLEATFVTGVAEENETRSVLRRAFLKAMEPKAFMKEYEATLEQLYNSALVNGEEEEELTQLSLSKECLSHIHLLPKEVPSDLLAAFTAIGVILHPETSPRQPDIVLSMGREVTLPSSLLDRNKDTPLILSYCRDLELPTVTEPHTVSDLKSCCGMGLVNLVTPSYKASKHILKQFSTKTSVIHPGVNWHVFKPISSPEEREDLRESYGIPEDAIVFLHVGVIEDVAPLLRSFYELACYHTNVFLILKDTARDGGGQQAITKHVQTFLADRVMDATTWKYTVSKRIIYIIDWMEQAEVAELYALADIYVSSNSLTSGTAPILEALACGNHVIVPKGHVVEEVASLPHSVVTYIPSQDEYHQSVKQQMEQSIQSQSTKNGGDVGEGRNYVIKHYSWERVALKWARLYLSKIKAVHTKMITSQFIPQQLSYGVGERHCKWETQEHKVSHQVIEHGAVSIYILDTDDAKVFFEEMLPTTPFVLVTLNTRTIVHEWCIPYLESTHHMIAWFAHNVCTRHEKLHCLPLGVNADKIEVLDSVRSSNYNRAAAKKQHLCYLGCDIKRHPQKRLPTKTLTEYYTWQDQTLSYKDYLTVLSTHQYAICPEDVSVDTHRFWECLYLGVTPVVLRSTWTDLWKNKVRMVVVDSWDKVTPTFLENAQPQGQIDTTHTYLDLTYYKRVIESYATTGIVLSKAQDDAFSFDTCLQQLRQHYHGIVVLWSDDTSELDALSTSYATLVTSASSKSSIMLEHHLSSAFFITTDVMVYRDLTALVMDLQDTCLYVRHSGNGVTFMPSVEACATSIPCRLPDTLCVSLADNSHIPKATKKVMATLQLNVGEDLKVWSTLPHIRTTQNADTTVGKHAKLITRKVVDLGSITLP